MSSFVRIAAACTLGVALMMSSASVVALEKTATKEVDQASTDLNTQMKITAFSAAVQAAIDQLMARVNLFDGRIDALEAWRPIIQAEVDALKNRVSALEGIVTYLNGAWRSWVEGQFGTFNTRITNIENRPAGFSRIAFDQACYTKTGWYGDHVGCNNADEVITMTCESGENADCRPPGGGSNKYLIIKCCRARLY